MLKYLDFAVLTAPIKYFFVFPKCTPMLRCSTLSDPRLILVKFTMSVTVHVVRIFASEAQPAKFISGFVDSNHEFLNSRVNPYLVCEGDNFDLLIKFQ